MDGRKKAPYYSWVFDWDELSIKEHDESAKRMVRKSKDDCFNVVNQNEREVGMQCDVLGCYLGAAMGVHPPLTPQGVRYCTAHYIAWRKLMLREELKDYYKSLEDEAKTNERRRNNTLTLSG